MRVIAGSARSLPLKTVKGKDVRPTTDRIKETLFNILSPYLQDSVFLDIFAGSGAIGIEALSRGAKESVFIEKSFSSLKIIKENLKFTGFEDKATVIQADAVSVMKDIARSTPFDVVFMDPPYGEGLWQSVLEVISESDFITEDTLIVAEDSLQELCEGDKIFSFEVTRIKKYRENMHVFLRKQKTKRMVVNNI